MCIFCSDNVVSACNRDEIITISIITEYARIRGIVDESPDLYEHECMMVGLLNYLMFTPLHVTSTRVFLVI